MFSLSNTTQMHVAFEIAALASLILWMNLTRKKTAQHLEQLLLRIQAQDEKIVRLEQMVRRLQKTVTLHQQQQQQQAAFIPPPPAPVIAPSLVPVPPPAPVIAPSLVPVPPPAPVIAPQSSPPPPPPPSWIEPEADLDAELDAEIQEELAELSLDPSSFQMMLGQPLASIPEDGEISTDDLKKKA